MAFAKRKQPGRRGLTLIELLMVIAIMTILLGVAIPMMRPAFQDRYLREAARMASAFFAGAQARAAELGRPVGVWIERNADGTELGSRHAVRLYMAEVPPSFTGATLESRVGVLINDAIGTLQFQGSDEAIARNIIAPGEWFTIKFDHKGFNYVGSRSESGTTFDIKIPLRYIPGADSPNGLSYEITRGPTRSAVNPLVLPADAVIDLSLSGTTSRRELDPVAAGIASPVVIMFAPSGRVDHVYVSNEPEPLSAPIHLLIGRKARVVDPLTMSVWSPETTNLADPTCLWVTVSNRTGSVITSDNTGTSFTGTLPLPRLSSERLKDAREFARSSIQKGGR